MFSTVSIPTARSNTYEDDGLLIQAGPVNISRDAQNGLISATNTGVLATTFSYNSFGELSNHSVEASGVSLYNVSYVHDGLGRITQKVETIAGATNTYDYTYDLTGRLLQVSVDGMVTGSYAYDQNDNRSGAIINGSSMTANIDNQDRLNQYGNTTYSYDLNGALQTKTNTDGSTAYVYDSIGNLRQVTLPDSTIFTYVIDGNDRRVAKQINGITVHSVIYDGQYNAVAELDGTGNVTARYIYGPWDHVPVAMYRDGNTYRIVSDTVGSVRLVVDQSNGTVVQRLDYDEWGNVITDTNPGFQMFGFAGGIYDQDTGLVRFGARDYDPEIGRWTATDPVGHFGQDSNLYAYAYNDPINNADPSGQLLNVLVGCALGAGAELAWQFIVEKKSVDCVEWTEVAKSAVAGCAGAGLLNKLGKLGKAANCLGNSFSQETPVHAESGVKPIANIKTGEKVLTYNQTTGIVGYELVTNIIQSTKLQQLFTLTLETGNVIEATGEHPFYLKGKGWRPAKVLKAGDILQTYDNKAILIKEVATASREETVYNLNVANTNTFYAGIDGVLVHNARCKKGKRQDLPSIDGTGKVHGKLPRPKDLKNYSSDELSQLRDELRRSVQQRIRKNVELGFDRAHGQRQAAEQQLIKSIDKFLGK